MKTPKRVSVAKRPSAEQIKNSERWEAFIKASGYSFDKLTDEWMEFFDAQAEPKTASTELVRLIDIAILKDEPK
jgi:hypothetical protein